MLPLHGFVFRSMQRGIARAAMRIHAELEQRTPTHTALYAMADTSADQNLVNQYFELAMDLNAKKRRRFLAQLDTDQPEVAATVRKLIETGISNPHFACHSPEPR